jgi:hypothetical protein
VSHLERFSCNHKAAQYDLERDAAMLAAFIGHFTPAILFRRRKGCLPMCGECQESAWADKNDGRKIRRFTDECQQVALLEAHRAG